ncbi:hypothetical protein S40285_10204 [Stachybotrys chlorohalonatus IBT 40285]|uniref:Uncharacterized protein n=1 Tax=Stachybotrys chlorohalonatus (strain IBT 40285) TaxID=1283841 RepID=A0A084QG75_STAC4|nr:hypothetical protein S40285_10204 [Stachybotrys chlorohalonata IBT 40285]
MAVSEELQLTGVFPFRASWDESQYLISNTGHEANLYLPNETSSRFDRRPIIVPLPNAATFPCVPSSRRNYHARPQEPNGGTPRGQRRSLFLTGRGGVVATAVVESLQFGFWAHDRVLMTKNGALGGKGGEAGFRTPETAGLSPRRTLLKEIYAKAEASTDPQDIRGQPGTLLSL